MAFLSQRQLLDKAATGGYGVGAFNVNDVRRVNVDADCRRR